MKSLLKIIAPFILSLAVIVAGLYAYSQVPVPNVEQSFGAFTPVGGSTYVLSGSGVVSTATTIPVTAFKTPDGRALTMAMFGSIGYAVLDPNSPSKIEDITFTGITQNANGSALLTGVSRGMDFVTPYSASSTLAQAHAGGSYLILSNTAGFYGQQFLFANNNSSSTAFMTFSPSAPPAYYPNVGQQAVGTYNATTSEFASITYVNSVVAAGAANATAAVKGIVQLASAIQSAAGTALGSTGASLVPPNSLFNSTQSATTIVPVTNTSGKLSQAFLDLTQAFSPSGTWNFLSNVGIGTSSPYAPLSVVGARGVVADIFTATSTLINATSSFAANLSVARTASTTNLVISGTCTNGAGSGCNKVTIVTGSTGALSTGNNAVSTFTASCSGTQVVAGGGGTNGGATTNWLAESFPSSATQWTAVFIAGSTGGGAGTGGAYAICVNP